VEQQLLGTPFHSRLLALTNNIRLGLKGLSVANALAYFAIFIGDKLKIVFQCWHQFRIGKNELIQIVKTGPNVIKLFTAVIYGFT
jgi:hypothetical protein